MLGECAVNIHQHIRFGVDAILVLRSEYRQQKKSYNQTEKLSNQIEQAKRENFIN